MRYTGKEKSEKAEKIEVRTHSHEVNERQRKHAVRSVLEGGEKPSEVMKSTGLCSTSVYKWLRKARQGGHAALGASVSKGPAPHQGPCRSGRCAAG